MIRIFIILYKQRIDPLILLLLLCPRLKYGPSSSVSSAWIIPYLTAFIIIVQLERAASLYSPSIHSLHGPQKPTSGTWSGRHLPRKQQQQQLQLRPRRQQIVGLHFDGRHYVISGGLTVLFLLDIKLWMLGLAKNFSTLNPLLLPPRTRCCHPVNFIRQPL